MSAQMTFELPRDEHAPARARAAVGAFADSLEEHRFECARLLLTELVTNAVKYGGDAAVRVELLHTGDCFRAEVVDGGSGFAPRRRDPDDWSRDGGWGLPLVEHLADRWGAYQGSTHVWFEIDVWRPPASTSPQSAPT